MLVLKNTEDILHRFDYYRLKNLCVIVGIKTRVRQNTKLVRLLISHFASTKIQRKFRYRLMKYNICPITHDLLKYPFVSIRHPNGHFNYYSLEGIASWFRKDRDYICPNTRYKVSPDKLEEINYIYHFYYKRKLIREQKNTISNDTNDLDITWAGRNLLVFVKNLDNINYLSINTINQVVIPYIMNNLYFIFNRNHEYALMILSIILSIITTTNIENRQYIINQIKEIL